MVVGNGMIARRFHEYKNDDRFVIFASGVSDSSASENAVFKREETMLLETCETHPDKFFVYFSTCSVYDDGLISSPYVQHKLAMESLIKKYSYNYTIFRVSNPVGNTENKHTILNFFIHAIKNEMLLKVYSNAERNLIDIDDMYLACQYILHHSLFQNRITNIANPANYAVLYIIKTIETFFNKNAYITIEEKYSIPRIDTADIHSIYKELHINFAGDYLTNVLDKYYS